MKWGGVAQKEVRDLIPITGFLHGVFCLFVCGRLGLFLPDVIWLSGFLPFYAILSSSLQSHDSLVCPPYHTLFIPLSQISLIPCITWLLSGSLMGVCRHRDSFLYWCPMLPSEPTGVGVLGLLLAVESFHSVPRISARHYFLAWYFAISPALFFAFLHYNASCRSIKISDEKQVQMRQYRWNRKAKSEKR